MGEKVEEAAKRELLEETGLIANQLTLFGVFSGPEQYNVYPDGNEAYIIDIVYLCNDFTGDIHGQEAEVLELKWFDFDKIPEKLSPPIKSVLTKFCNEQLEKRINTHDRSEKRAREILQEYLKTITSEYGKYIESIILVGSLSNGSYIEGPGRDIDLVTVLKDTANEEVRNAILMKINETENKFNNDVPIARTVYKLSEMKRPFNTNLELKIENKHLLEITIELQRVHESGIVLFGNNIIGDLHVPTREEVICFDNLRKKWSEEEISKNPRMLEVLENPPINLLIQILITNAFRHYYYASGKSCSNKNEIARWMAKDVVNYKFQKALDIATKYKLHPAKDIDQDELRILREAYHELRVWKETKPVEAVPLG